MTTKILLEELSFGSNFGILRAIGFNRVWCYFLVSIVKIKKHRIDSISWSLRVSIVVLRAFGSKCRFPVDTFQTKKPHSIISTRSWVLVYITFAHGRTDRHFLKKFYFFLLIKNIYTCLYLSRLFLKFHPHSDQS